MGLDEVKKEIIDDANKKADEILAKAQAEAEQVFDETRQKALDERTKADANTSALIETLVQREIAAAEFDARKMMLDAKKELIDESIERARQKIASWSDTKRGSIFKKLMAKAKSELDLAIVAANPKDKKHVKGTTFESADILAGMIGRTKDGRVSVDYSVDEMLQSIRDNELAQIGAVLF